MHIHHIKKQSEYIMFIILENTKNLDISNCE